MPETMPIPEDRPLTTAEESLVRWLLEHGTRQVTAYLPQLGQARVMSRCYCGCASINFAIGGVIPAAGEAIDILADYEWQADDGPLFGVFVFARVGLLAGLEVWSVDGLAPAVSLPEIRQLRPLGASQNV